VAETPIYPYVVTLKNENARYINIIGFLLSICSALLFLRELLLQNTLVPAYLAGILFILGLIVWNYIQYRKGDKRVYFAKALLIAGLVWTRMPYFQWLIVVFVLLALLEYQAKHEVEIGFSQNHIVFNQLIKKRYPWSAIDNVVIKDGLLTIDFKNNRLLQKETDDSEEDADEDEFNLWCQRQLSRQRPPGSD